MVFISTLRFLKIISCLAVVCTAVWISSKFLSFNYFPGLAGELQLYQDYSIDVIDFLASDYKSCLKMPSKLICVIASEEQLRVLEKGDLYHRSNGEPNAKIPERRVKRRHPVDAIISDFTAVMTDFDIEIILIEPSMLFCILTEELKVLLLKRRFDMSTLLGDSHIVNFAVMEEHSENIKLHSKAIEKYGFRYYEIVTEGEKWLMEQKKNNVSTHHFFVRRRLLVHIVVMFRRRDYLWHARLHSLPNGLEKIVTLENLLFAYENSAYDKFVGSAVDTNSTKLFIPSDPTHFLSQISCSKFLHCESSRLQRTDLFQGPPGPLEKLRTAFVGSVREIRYQLRPMVLNFFLMDSTLKGWYNHCDVSSESSVLQFGMWRADNRTYRRIMDKFTFNSRLKLRKDIHMPDDFGLNLMFRDTNVRIYFIYRQTSQAGDDQRYVLPNFTICSTELLGQLVHVPCEAEPILELTENFASSTKLNHGE